MGLYAIELVRHRVQYANHIYPHTLGYRSAFENMTRGKNQRVAQDKEPLTESDEEEASDDNREGDKVGSDASDNGSSC